MRQGWEQGEAGLRACIKRQIASRRRAPEARTALRTAALALPALMLTLLSACMGLDEWQALRIAKAECDRDGLIKVFDEKVWADLKAKSSRDTPLNHIADIVHRGSWKDPDNKYIGRQIYDVLFNGKIIVRYKDVWASRDPPFYSWAETYETQFSCSDDEFPIETRLIRLGY